MVKQSALLTEFYRAYRDWSVDPTTNAMQITQGLCNNLHNYCVDHGWDARKLRNEMRQQFSDSDLDTVYPFHDGDEDKYEDECAAKRTLMNVLRLLWVNEHCR